jgi:hypothetical protein
MQAQARVISGRAAQRRADELSFWALQREQRSNTHPMVQVDRHRYSGGRIPLAARTISKRN